MSAVSGNISEYLYDLSICAQCDMIESCNGPVPPDGKLLGNVFVIGEAPGETEDEKRLPFVGKSGEVLEEACKEAGFDIRKKCHITNVVKCRPTGNRTPSDAEGRFCSDLWLRQELRMARPKHVLMLGRFAQSFILPYSTMVHGGRVNIQGTKYLFLYHPSYWLRQGGKNYTKREVVPHLRAWYKTWRNDNG